MSRSLTTMQTIIAILFVLTLAHPIDAQATGQATLHNCTLALNAMDGNKPTD